MHHDDVGRTADEPSVAAKWDRGLTQRFVDLQRPIVKTYFRSQVLGLEHVPPGAALMVANHSGGLVTVDMSVIAVDYYKTFGYERPLYALAHDNLFRGPAAGFLERTGVIRATPEHASEALAAGGLVLVFPGGDYDVYRPTSLRTNILPVTIGFPFGLSVVLPINIPLPTKIVTQVLPPDRHRRRVR